MRFVLILACSILVGCVGDRDSPYSMRSGVYGFRLTSKYRADSPEQTESFPAFVVHEGNDVTIAPSLPILGDFKELDGTLSKNTFLWKNERGGIEGTLTADDRLELRVEKQSKGVQGSPDEVKYIVAKDLLSEALKFYADNRDRLATFTDPGSRQLFQQYDNLLKCIPNVRSQQDWEDCHSEWSKYWNRKLHEVRR